MKKEECIKNKDTNLKDNFTNQKNANQQQINEQIKYIAENIIKDYEYAFEVLGNGEV